MRTASTIGAGGLDFRVRDGTGYFPAAQITRGICFSNKQVWKVPRTLKTEQKVDCELCTRRFQYINIPRASPRALVVVRSGLTSFTRLPYQGDGLSPRLLAYAMGDLILGHASHLDAFSGYHCRTWLPSDAVGTTTGTPAVRPLWSSRTKSSSPQIPCAHTG